MPLSEHSRSRAKQAGAIALLAGGIVLVVAAAGAVVVTRAALRSRARHGAVAPDRAEPRARQLARLAGGLLRRLIYGALRATAATAAWLAELLRPPSR